MVVSRALTAVILLMVRASLVLASSRIDPNVGTSSVKDNLVSLIWRPYPNFTNILGVLKVVKLDIVEELGC